MLVRSAEKDWSHTACVRPAVHVTRPPHRTSSGRRRGELTRAPEIFQFGDVSPPNKAACPAPRVAPRPPVCRPTPPFSGGGWRAAGTPRTFLPTVVGRVVANHGQFSDFLNLIIGYSVGRARDWPAPKGGWLDAMGHGCRFSQLTVLYNACIRRAQVSIRIQNIQARWISSLSTRLRRQGSRGGSAAGLGRYGADTRG